MNFIYNIEKKRLRRDVKIQISVAVGVKVLFCIIGKMVGLIISCKSSRPAISKSLRSAIWVKQFGKTFENKCPVSWCKNIITPFTFVTGHDIPHSRGGATNIHNLIPICDCCNQSMAANYTIKQFSKLFKDDERGIIHFP